MYWFVLSIFRCLLAVCCKLFSAVVGIQDVDRSLCDKPNIGSLVLVANNLINDKRVPAIFIRAGSTVLIEICNVAHYIYYAHVQTNLYYLDSINNTKNCDRNSSWTRMCINVIVTDQFCLSMQCISCFCIPRKGNFEAANSKHMLRRQTLDMQLCHAHVRHSFWFHPFIDFYQLTSIQMLCLVLAVNGKQASGGNISLNTHTSVETPVN